MNERRTARRYGLKLPIAIRAPHETKAISRTGKTRDISTRGVYFSIDNEIGLGAELDLTMTLSAEVTGGSEVLIKATAKVVRVDKISWDGGRKINVAATFEMYEIVRKEAAIA